MTRSDQHPEDGASPRSVNDTVAQTAPGMPDATAGPEERGPAALPADAGEFDDTWDKLENHLGPHSDVPEGP